MNQNTNNMYNRRVITTRSKTTAFYWFSFQKITYINDYLKIRIHITHTKNTYVCVHVNNNIKKPQHIHSSPIQVLYIISIYANSHVGKNKFGR